MLQELLAIFLLFYVVRYSHGSKPNIYVSNGSHIVSYTKEDSRVQAVLGQRDYRIVGLAVDISNELLFWSDISSEHRGIYRSDLNGNNISKIVSDVSEINGLTVDWISRHIYWTDVERKTVEVANYDGSGRRILVSRELKSPNSIVAAPLFGLLFWVDQRSMRIERSWLDGSHRRTVVQAPEYWPNQLAVNYISRQLYWVDVNQHAVFSCSIDGKNVKKEVDYKKISKDSPGFGLVVYGNTAVMTTWFNTAVYSILLGSKQPVWQQEVKSLGTRELFNIVSLNPATQTMTFHPCMEEDNGGCSHLCLPTHKNKYVCQCPTSGGLTLSEDGKSCEVPTEIYLCTFEDTGDIGFVPVDNNNETDTNDLPEVTLISKSTKPDSLAYDPTEKMIYWSDLSEGNIYRSKLDGSAKEIFLNGSQGIAKVESMSFSYKTGSIYFINSVQSGLNGDQYHWKKIEMVDTSTLSQKSLFPNITKPVGLAVDDDQSYLYVLSAGSLPAVIRADLDGKDQVVLPINISNPISLTLSDRLLTLTFESQENGTLLIAVREFDLENFSMISENKLPRKILVKGRRIKNAVFTKTVISSTSDHISACTEAGCSNGCVPLPKGRQFKYRCTCPDELGVVLGSNGKTCQKPVNFLLFSDITTINMIALDKGSSEEVVVVLRGDVQSDIAALTYDKHNERLYWIDLARNAIYVTNFLQRFEPLLVYTEEGSISDALVIDSRKQLLYWIGSYGTDGGWFIASMSIVRGLNSYKRLLNTRSKPSALALHPSGRWMFWVQETTEDRDRWDILKSKTNGRLVEKIVTLNSKSPFAMRATDDNNLYIGGQNGHIYVYNDKGALMQDIQALNGHITSIVVYQSLVVYSEQQYPSVHILDLVTRTSVVLAENLARPTAIVLQQQGNINETCSRSQSLCSDVCIPFFRGEYRCGCPSGLVLNNETGTCSPLELTTRSAPPLTTTTAYVSAVKQSTTDISTHTTVITSTTGFNGYATSTDEQQKLKIEITVSNSVVNHTQDTTTPTALTVEDIEIDDIDTRNSIETKLQGNKNGIDVSSQLYDISSQQRYNVSSQQHQESERAHTASDNFVTSFTTEVENVKYNNVASSEETEYNVAASSEERKYKVAASSETQAIYSHVTKQDKPYFKNCPQGETIKANVPEADNKVLVPVQPTGFDTNGSPLPLHCNYEITQEGVVVHWIGDERESHHNVTFTVYDSHGQATECTFKVILHDLEPPKFSFCPPNIKVRVDRQRENVYWSEPEMIDNVGVKTMNKSHDPGSPFDSGEHVVSYTAIDAAGNMAHCSFKVFILHDKVCDLPETQNGGIVCSQDNQVATKECKFICEAGYVVNPVRVFKRIFNCNFPEEMDSLRKTMQTQKPCLKHSYPSIVKQEFHLRFHGPISKHQTEVKSYLDNAIASHLEKKRLCYGAVCNVSYLTVKCSLEGDTVAKEEGKETAEANYSCLADENAKQFFIAFNITLFNNTETVNDSKTLLQDVHLSLMSLASLLQLQLEGHVFAALPESLSSSPAIWSCPLGQIMDEGVCIACPPGTFHNSSLNVCQYCMNGHYQDLEGQLTCRTCSIGNVLTDGATSSSQCHILPSMDEMTLFIIVTTCSFGVVFLCMAITLYLQFQRQQKQKQQSSNQKKPRYNISPNIYVAPPPILKSKLDENLSPGHRTYSIDRKYPVNIYSNIEYDDADRQSDMAPMSYNSDLFNVLSGPGIQQMQRDFSVGDEIPTGTLSRENTFSNPTYSPQFGVKRSERNTMKGMNTPSPGQQRKMSRDSTFSNQSPRIIRSQWTPTSDTPLITQSPLLRLKLAAYNLNHED